MDAPKKRLIRLPEVINRTGYRRAMIYKMIAAGTFAKPVPLGVKSIAFVEDEVDSWIEARIAARDAVPASARQPCRRRSTAAVADAAGK